MQLISRKVSAVSASTSSTLCRRLRPVALLMALAPFSMACATVKNRPVRTELAQREEVDAKVAEVTVSRSRESDGKDDDVQISAQGTGRCRKVTRLRVGTEASVEGGVADVIIGSAFAILGGVELAAGAKCHSDPTSCPKGGATQDASGGGTDKFSGGGNEGTVGVLALSVGALLLGHGIYKYATAEDHLRETEEQSNPYECNKGSVPGGDMSLRLAPDKDVDGRGSGGTITFPGARAWILDHPDVLDRKTVDVVVGGTAFPVQWSSILDVSDMKKRAIALAMQRRLEKDESARVARFREVFPARLKDGFVTDGLALGASLASLKESVGLTSVEAAKCLHTALCELAEEGKPLPGKLQVFRLKSTSLPGFADGQVTLRDGKVVAVLVWFGTDTGVTPERWSKGFKDSYSVPEAGNSQESVTQPGNIAVRRLTFGTTHVGFSMMKVSDRNDLAAADDRARKDRERAAKFKQAAAAGAAQKANADAAAKKAVEDQKKPKQGTGQSGRKPVE